MATETPDSDLDLDGLEHDDELAQPQRRRPRDERAEELARRELEQAVSEAHANVEDARRLLAESQAAYAKASQELSDFTQGHQLTLHELNLKQREATRVEDNRAQEAQQAIKTILGANRLTRRRYPAPKSAPQE